MLHRIRLGENQPGDGIHDSEIDPALEDEMRSAKLMEMMNNIRGSDHDDSDNDHDLDEFLNTTKKTASANKNAIADYANDKNTSNNNNKDDYFNSLANLQRETTANKNNHIVDNQNDDDDDDAIFNQLVSQNLI
jgi:hypothetical protein